MDAIFSTRSRRILGLTGFGVFSVFGILFFVTSWARVLLPYLLISAVALGAIWIGGYYLVRGMRRRKQRGFDAGVAAKEGIEDRKREWASWTEELATQGIDRYELPFYLLLGEPQSGKSVLLQNSDLHFPFGQTRLSGIGGTRGCDWWFTEEAVVLDLAGRLFTHEGGASDEAEWEAFLELLADYRPTNPANGVMLVIPSDSLLQDSREEAGRKADRIKNALLTLTSKLQAQLPIYVVLTKADRIFGFAETVHRLDAETRHQMFGWSRPAANYEAPFDMVEVREAFGDLVDRARILRDTMLSTARLPEAIPEVDRMYVFPDELEGTLPTLEVYLKRIFSESTLVDRLYFRGFYVTSGLQSGAPVAKVCAELLGGTGEADLRDLEGLFTKQHAYFIKDLIRRRVFSERGLVRPTRLRVARARRNAWVGYGVAAVIALFTTIFSIVHVFSEPPELDREAYKAAIESARTIADQVAGGQSIQPSVVVASLDQIHGASQVDPGLLGGTFQNTREVFEGLYDETFDRALTGALRETAESNLDDVVGARDPASHDQFVNWTAMAGRLLEGVAYSKSAQVGELAGMLRLDPEQAPVAIRLEELVELHTAALPSDAPRRSNLGALEAGPLASAVGRLSGWWYRTLTPGDEIQVTGHLGYLLAWKGIEESYSALAALSLDSAVDVHDPGERYFRSLHALRAREDDLEKIDDRKRKLLSREVEGERGLKGLGDGRAAFLALASGGSGEPSSWDLLLEVRAFAERKFAGAQAAIEAASPTGNQLALAGLGTYLSVPDDALRTRLEDDLLLAACEPSDLDDGGWRPGELPGRLASGLTTWVEGGGLPAKVFQAKSLSVGGRYVERFPTWRALAEELNGAPPPAAADVDTGLVAHLTDLHARLAELDRKLTGAGRYGTWTGHVDGLLLAHLRDAEPRVSAWTGDRTELDGAFLGALAPAGAPGSDLARLATTLRHTHLRQVERNLMDRWRVPGVDTVTVVEELHGHLVRVAAGFGEGLQDEEQAGHGAWLEDEVAALLQGRFDAHRQEVEVFASRDQLTGKTLEYAVQNVPEWLGDLPAWQEELAGEDAPDPDAYALTAFFGDETVTGSSELEVAVEAHAAYARVSRRETERKVKRDPYADSLETFVLRFMNPPHEDRGPWLADKLIEGLARDTPVNPEGPQKAVEVYVENMYTAFVELLEVELRKSYLAEIEGQIWDAHEILMQALYVDVGDQDQLRSLTVNHGRIQSALGYVFDVDGKLDELLAAYHLSGTEDLLSFREGRQGDAAGKQAWWVFEGFLLDLQDYLRGGDPSTALNETELTVSLTPDTSLSPSTNVWASGAFTWFHSPFNPRVADADPDPVRIVPTGMVEMPLAWNFGPRPDPLVLRWSESSRKTMDEAKDAVVQAHTCLAPLLMAWSSGTPPGAPAKRRWRIDRLSPANTTLYAPITLEFSRPLPMRPTRPK